MELFESNQPYPDQQPTALPVEPEPRYQPAAASQPAQTNQHGHAWIHTIGLILLGLVLVIAIVLLARWAYHRTHHHNSTTGSSKVSTSAKLSNPSTKQTANGGSGSQKSSSSTPKSSSSSSSTTTPPPASSTKITNTGPGNVVGLFVGTSLAAAGLHFVISLRRFNRA